MPMKEQFLQQRALFLLGVSCSPRMGRGCPPGAPAHVQGRVILNPVLTKRLQKNLFYMLETLSVIRKECLIGSLFFDFLSDVYKVMKCFMDYKQRMDHILQQILGNYYWCYYSLIYLSFKNPISHFRTSTFKPALAVFQQNKQCLL